MASPNTGNTTQILSSITQSSDGYQLYHAQLHSTATTGAADGPFEFWPETFTATAEASSSLSITEADQLTSTATGVGTPTFEVVINFHATATATEDMANAEEVTTLAPSGGAASETIYPSTTLMTTSTATATDVITTFNGTIFTATAIATNTIEPGVIYNQTVTATASATDSLWSGLLENLTATATGDIVLTPYATVTETLEGIATGTDTQIYNSDVSESLTSIATGTSTWSFTGSIHNETLSSVANASDWMWAKDFEAIAWVLNTQSGGITNYDNFGFNSIAFHAGKLYATSPEGLFELGADNDDGRKIDALVKGGFDDYGTEEKKRMSDIYVGYTGGELECDVETYDGPEEVYTYGMEYRNADAPRNNRLKVGRGLSSRYWRLAFKNIGGADFQIYDVAVNIATSKRRL